MKKIDLRSDTVTLPTSEMMQAINNSILGDDVYEEDISTIELEKFAAKVTGKESALLVSSGTMGNLISSLVHCPRGTEAIMGNKSHTFIYESGGTHQSLFWKNLGLTSAKGGKIISKLVELGFVTKEAVTFEGSKTYAIIPSPIEIDYSLLMAEGHLSPFISHQDIDENSSEFTQWILSLPSLEDQPS